MEYFKQLHASNWMANKLLCHVHPLDNLIAMTSLPQQPWIVLLVTALDLQNAVQYSPKSKVGGCIYCSAAETKGCHSNLTTSHAELESFALRWKSHFQWVLQLLLQTKKRARDVIWRLCLFLCGPLMSWWLVQGVTLPSPYDSWESLQLIPVTLSSGTDGYKKMNEWIIP